MYTVAFAALIGATSAVRCPKIDCSRVPPSTHIKDLNPCDVTTVMSLGDSITAAAVPYPLYSGIFEYPGISFSMGGDADFYTLPNMLQAVSGKKLKGPSRAWHSIEKAGSPHKYYDDHGNAAQSGAGAIDLVGRGGNQTEYLIAWAESANVTDDDWKVLTLFIGANDICGSCVNRTSPAEFGENVEAAIHIIRRNFKRVFINILPIFEVSQVHHLTEPSLYCRSFRRVIVECKCLSNYGEEGRAQMDRYTHEYNRISFNIAERWRKRGYDDFTVVAQPFMVDFKIPDIAWVSKLDCFHPSEIAHATLAKSLWHQMFEPVERKSAPLSGDTPVYCPQPGEPFAS